jgi:nucleoid-associated protein YgaU
LTPAPDPAPASAPGSSRSAPAFADPTASLPPASAPIAPPTDTSSGTWVALKNLGKGFALDDDDRRTPEPGSARLAGREPRATGPGEPGAAPTSSGRAASSTSQVEPVAHTVQKDENFWTISRLYYGYGRFWKALWAANRATVKAPDLLYVGQIIRIPPPESLDPTLVEPERSSRSAVTTQGENSASTFRRASRPVGGAPRVADAGRVENEVELPTVDPFARRRADGLSGPDPEKDPAVRPRRPRYKVRPYETLRSIARDTLGDSRRADEILDLNAKVVDDPARLTPGQLLELPDDARINSSGSRRDR